MAYSGTNLLPDNVAEFEGGTTAWVAGANTTQSVSSVEFLTGSKSMKLVAVASGSITTTSPRVLVTAGTEYVFQAPIRNSAATAGRVATFTITWYNATSGGSSLGTTVATVNVTNQSGWNALNYPTVSGVAPVGALSCTMTLAVSGLAAAEFVNTDRVWAAIAPNRAGNLLTFSASSMETNVTDWSATNGTTAKVYDNPAVGAGYYCLGVTSAAAGDVVVSTAAYYNVTAGNVYVAYAAVKANTVAQTVYIELRWYDAANAQVGVDQRSKAFAAAGNIERLAVSGTAPVGATKCKLYIRPQATAASQLTSIDDASITVAPNVAGNLLTYEEFSTESTLPAWTINDVTYSREYLTSGITDGFYALKLIPTANAVITGSLDRLVPVTPGTTYQVGAVLWRHNNNPANTIVSTFRTRIDWYDSTGALFLADNPDQFYSQYSNADWVAHQNSETRTCPVGAAYARVAFEIDHTATTADYYYVDNVKLVPASPEYVIVVDNATASISLTINSAPSGGSGTTAITIQRMDADGKASPLRGYGTEYTKAPWSASPVVVEDYEAPLASRVWYAIEWFKADGTSTLRLYTQTVATPVLDDGDYVWFKSPGIPALNTRVMMEAPLKWTRAARSQTFDIVGRKNPISKSGVRGGRSGSLSVLVWDAASNALFDSLLDSGLPVLIQAMPGYGLEGNLYLAVDDVSSDPLDPDATEEGWRWTLAVSERDRPAGGLQGSAVTTWQTINDGYATWADLFNARVTWAEVLTKG